MILKHSIVDNKIVEYDGNNKLIWIELIDATESEIKQIIEEYQIPNDYISDIDDPYELPRVEGLKDDNPDLFILNYPIKLEEKVYITRALSLIVVEDIIITVRNEDSKVFQDLKNNSSLRNNDINDIQTLLIEIAWLISNNFIEYVKILNNEIKSLEMKLKKSTKTELLYEMIDIEKSLINFEAATRENSPVISSIFDIESSTKSHQKTSLLKDLQKENKQAKVMIEKSLDFLEKLSDLYSNVISNNMNTVMKILTSASIVMTVPTIIGGLWGMNTNLPLANHPNAFWYLVLLSVALSLAIIFYLKKKDFL